MQERHGVPAKQVKLRVVGFSAAAGGGTIASVETTIEEALRNPEVYSEDFRYDGATLTGSGPIGAAKAAAVSASGISLKQMIGSFNTDLRE
jgi:hypothetical protein